MDKYCRKKQNNVNSIASFIVDSSSINYSSPFPTTTHTNKIIPNKVNDFLIYCEVRDILSKQKYNTVKPSGINKILVIYTTKPNPEIQKSSFSMMIVIIFYLHQILYLILHLILNHHKNITTNGLLNYHNL